MGDGNDYGDEKIRLYMRVLRRMIILTAVIVAVPVMMWTITVFARSYVAGPKPVVLQHVASTVSPSAAPTQTASVPAPQTMDQPPSEADRADAAASSDGQSLAWNNPNSSSPPSFPAPAVLAPPPIGGAELLPPDESIPGLVPLPRQRPSVFAPIPLPRVRPSETSAETQSGD